MIRVPAIARLGVVLAVAIAVVIAAIVPGVASASAGSAAPSVAAAPSVDAASSASAAPFGAEASSAAAASSGAPTVHTATSDLAFVDRMLFDTSIKDFQHAADDGDPWFDWSTDGCSAPLVGNTGRSFDFTASCHRHDFGYRNLRRLESRYGVDDWNESARKDVDQQFREDMRNHCHGRSWLLRPTCYAWAQAFYTAVRLAG